MVISALVDMVFIPLNALIFLLPDSVLYHVSSLEVPIILKYAANFFPMDLVWFVISFFFSWYSIFMAWAAIEWVYKKIPGVS